MYLNFRSRFTSGLLALTACFSVSARASHYEVMSETDKSPIQCLVQDLRYPEWTNGHYLACYSQYFSTKEKWGGYFYGGFVGSAKATENLIQFSSWQMSGKGVPASDIDFVYAGKHMSWAKSTWEGSAGGIKGKWPAAEFKENTWHRFVARTWSTPEDESHSYVGIWMKDIETGVWNHLATKRFPGIIDNLNHFFGFQENFTGGNADPVAHLNIRNTYSLRGDKWVADNKCQFRPQGDGDKKERLKLKAIEGGKTLLLETAWTYVDKATAALKKDPEYIPETQNIVYHQPEQPTFFDPIKVTSLGAACTGSQLLVKWDLAPVSCPQLGYKLEVFATAERKGEPVLILAGNDPEKRSLLVDGVFATMPGVRLTLTDIYGNPGAPVDRAAIALKESVAKAPAGLVPGLNYRYFEAPEKTSWSGIPDFAKLTPVREGAVSEPELSNRLRRKNYAFDFSGQIAIEKPGIYEFSLVHASGAKLLIDGQPVIEADGYHSIVKAVGSTRLAAGKHSLTLQYVQGEPQSQQADDFLQLLWAGPGFAKKPVRIPVTVYSRQPAAGEPSVVFTPPAGDGSAPVKLAAEVAKLSGSPASVQYYMADPDFDYFRAQGAQGGDYFIGQTQGAMVPLETRLWGGPKKTVRARLIYGKNRTIDSEPVSFATATPDLGPWTLSELEHHQYPVSARVSGDAVALVGESMALLTRPMTGDCTLIARLAEITPNAPGPDGSAPAGGVWQAGIILRNDLDASPGEPLGGNTHYSALLGCVDGSIRFCDSLMKNGAGNQPSGDVGGTKRWLKISRAGDVFTNSVSEDGKEWTAVKTVNLPKMSPALHAGFFIYALPSSTTLLHHAVFDHVSLK